MPGTPSTGETKTRQKNLWAAATITTSATRGRTRDREADVEQRSSKRLA
jgi:hypothetical protein